jgi:hypothetical protein
MAGLGLTDCDSNVGPPHPGKENLVRNCKLRSMHSCSTLENDSLLRRGRSADRRKFVDPSVCHQRQKETTILHCVASHELPVLNYSVMERAGRALRAGERERAELELVRSRRFPCSTPTVTVDPRAYITVRPEGDRPDRRASVFVHRCFET